MKFLKFISQKNEDPYERGSRINFTYVIGNSAEEIIKADDKVVKSISVRLTGRDDASLRAPQYKNYQLEPALFAIAKNFLTKKITEKKEIKEKEELLLDASEYLHLETDILDGFHTEIIVIDE